MQLCCKLLYIPAYIRIVALPKNQLLNEEVLCFGRVRRRIELEQAAIGIWIDMRDTVGQSRLVGDILFGYATVVVLQCISCTAPACAAPSGARSRLDFSLALPSGFRSLLSR
jgi:hypothetical protein